ncbi:hypothetical protein [Chitinolyticbacter meiyuanensis]|uniref:hypothetical protein n=1 Tax=Chitinolyticbacter meiyuanensis TaxID=682798 RepID=UPI0011E5F19B|nr:hypothetical protein [Chitinolyticbacter meiyuanensis]
MKERPILMSAPMVLAILAGTKKQTRRTVKPQPYQSEYEPALLHYDDVLKAPWVGTDGVKVPKGTHYHATTTTEGFAKRCPYGQPGDRLWVRESLQYDSEYGHLYAAGGQHGQTVYLCSLFDDEDAQTGYSYDGLLPERSVPSIHLPRRYSRLLLEITAVRVERLQSISEADAVAEGIERANDFFNCPCWKSYTKGEEQAVVFPDDPIGSYHSLWESINGPDSWAANPWVWVVEFKRLEVDQ